MYSALYGKGTSMAWFGFITKACEEAARRHGVWRQVEDFRDEIKKLQECALVRFQQFPPPYLVKKKFAGWEGRLIAKRYDFTDQQGEEHTVIVFLDFMTRGNNGYDKGFGQDPLKYGAAHYENLTTDDELEQYVREQLAKDPIPPLPEPSDYEWGYLTAALQQTEDWGDDYIYESQEWNDRINQKVYLHRQGQIYTLLGNCSFDQEGGGQAPIQSGGQEQILYYSFPTLHIIFLAGLGTAEELADLKQRYDEVLSDPSRELLARCSCRAYPRLVLGADLELWLNIESRESGNMALSPEESQLLERLEKAPDKAYPLFINGRAGSGKSTILQYLFSYYLHYYLKNREEGEDLLPPLYLTCNDRLLKRAQQNVEAFLRCSLRSMEDNPERLLQSSEGLFKKAFRPFYSFLKEQLPPETQNLFSPIRHIDYAKFTQMWKEHFRNEPRILSIGSETCWHVIRTYIKGCSVDDFLDPEDYEEGLRKEHSVPQDVFEQVYEQVWKAWYEEMTVDRTDETKPGEFWDDQDLVRYVVRNQFCRRLYPVVFCDEAQDFTRVEQNAILALSLFSQRKIYSHHIASLPFAFAGDPFQTLNPTGFRWEAVKNSFVEQFINSHHCSGQNISLNYCELLNNYRSDAEIVKFSNTVQKFRGSILKNDIVPQKPWRTSGGAVLYFDVNDSGFWSWAEAHRNEIVFVVPCNQGEEKEYWERESLSSHMRFDDVTVMSTVAIKGLEYNTIVTCGFGLEAPDGVSEYLKNGKNSSLNDDKTLPVEYFINKLYVAVSRAQHNLWIVDNATGNDSFWKYFKERDFLPCLPDEERKDSNIVFLREGQAASLSGNPQNDREAAEKLCRDGRENRSSYLMGRAARIFQDFGLNARANECSAWAFFYEKKYNEAAEAVESDTNFTFKHQCWWLLGTKESLKKIYETRKYHSEFVRCPEYLFVEKFATGSLETDDPEKVYSDIIRLFTEQREQLYELEEASAPWQLIVGTVGYAQKEKTFDESKRQRLWKLGEELRGQGLFPADPECIASLALACGEYKEVKSLINDSRNELYRRADRLEQSPDQQIQSLFSSKKWRDIYELFQKHAVGDFSEPAQRQLAEANAICGNVDLLTKLLRNHYSADLVKKILENRELPPPIKKQISRINICAMVAAEDEVAIGDFLKRCSRDESRMFVAAFARCNAEEMQKKEVAFLGKIVQFLKKWLSIEEKHYISEHFFEIGCALEKANNIKESREFYKSAEKYIRNSREKRDLALKRQLVCLERHIEILPNPAYQKREAQKLREQLNLVGVEVGSPKLPEYEYSNNPWDLLVESDDALSAPSAEISASVTWKGDSDRDSAVGSESPAKGSAVSTAPEKETDKAEMDVPVEETPETSDGKKTESRAAAAGEMSDALSSHSEEISGDEKPIADCDLTLMEQLDQVQADGSTLEEMFRQLASFPAPEELSRSFETFLHHYRRLYRNTDEIRRDNAGFNSLEQFRELIQAHEEEQRRLSILHQYQEFLQSLVLEIQKLRLMESREPELKEYLQPQLEDFKQHAARNIPQYSDHEVPRKWDLSLNAAEWLHDLLLEGDKSVLFLQVLPHCRDLLKLFRALRGDIELPDC